MSVTSIKECDEGKEAIKIPCECNEKNGYRRDYKSVKVSTVNGRCCGNNLMMVTCKEIKEVLSEQPSSSGDKWKNMVPFNRQTNSDLKIDYYKHGVVSTGKRKDLNTNDIEQILESPDLVVEVGKSIFKCRSDILKKFTQYFNDIGELRSKRVVLCEKCISSRTFSLIYNWMQFYSENGNMIRPDDLYPVLKGAIFLKIPALENEIWKTLSDEKRFREEVAFIVYKQASEDSNLDVVELMLPKIRNYFTVLANTQEFLNLSTKQLIPLLSSRYICVRSELEVLSAGSKWLMEDWECRRDYCPDVMKTVRFGLLDSKQLVKLKCSQHEVINNEFTNRLIDDAIVLNSLKSEFNFPQNKSDEFWRKCDELSITVPMPRMPA